MIGVVGRKLLVYLGVALALGFVAVGATAPPASAHATLMSSQPGNGDVIDASPEQVVLEFSEPVDAADDAIELYDGSGSRVDVGPSRGSGTEVSAELPALDDGTYVVSWRAVSGDSHPITGAFQFRVGDGAAPDAGAEELVDEVLSGEGASDPLGVAYGIARFVLFGGMILLIGVPAFVALLWPDGAGDHRVRRMVTVGWVVVLASTVAAFGLQGAYSAGGTLADTVDPGRIGDVVGTRTGRVWLARLGLLVAVLVAWRGFLPRWRRAAASRPAVGVPGVGNVTLFGAALLASVSGAGHAATGDLVPLAMVADVVHLAGVSFWVAGLVLLFMVVLRGRGPDEGLPPSGGSERRTVDAVVALFSRFAFVAVIAIVLTGAFQSWRQVREVDALTGTTFGRLLIAKLALFVVIIGAAALSRWAVQRWSHQGAPGALRRSVGAEALLATGILAVTALLVNAVPGHDADADEPAAAGGVFRTEAHGSEVMVRLTVSPAEVGRTEVEVEPLTHELAPADVREVSASLSLPDRSIGDLPVSLEQDGNGAYTGDTEIPFSGSWDLEVVVRVDEVTQDRIPVELDVP